MSEGGAVGPLTSAGVYLVLLSGYVPKKTILLWAFKDADPRLQALSEHGGDEDWIAYIPEELAEDYSVMQLFESSTFSISGAYQEVVFKGLGKVLIGAHA